MLELDGEPVEIAENMVEVTASAKEGFTAALENGICVILDTTVSEALVIEGLARELISKIQQMRKQKDFEMMDRIHVFVDADEQVKKAIDQFKEFIKKETLADCIAEKTDLTVFDLNGHQTGINVEKI